jgi:glycerol-3-phosphate acyltransferase PlsY
VPTVGYILTLLIGYLLGSIPTGFLVGKARGVDIRTVGSGNIGATNVFRILGKTAGALVLLADAAKGWVAVFVAARLIAGWSYPNASPQVREWFALDAGVAAILGVLVALVPLALLMVLGIWVAVFALSRYVSLASICAAFALPFAAWLVRESGTIIVVTAVLAVLAIYRHKANIKRLMNGTENRIGGKKTAPSDPPTATA